MTYNEKILLKTAIEIINLNKNIGAKLTGSLMLAVRGISKRREASDIDIVCDYLCEHEDGLPVVPKGFKLIQMDGCKSQVDAIQFKNEDGIKIDFLYSDEISENVDGVLCGELKNLINAKRSYMENDIDILSKDKHELDLTYLFNNNKIDL